MLSVFLEVWGRHKRTLTLPSITQLSIIHRYKKFRGTTKVCLRGFSRSQKNLPEEDIKVNSKGDPVEEPLEELPPPENEFVPLFLLRWTNLIILWIEIFFSNVFRWNIVFEKEFLVFKCTGLRILKHGFSLFGAYTSYLIIDN